MGLLKSIGKVVGTVGGAVGGFMLGGPGGAIAGAALGGMSGHGIDVQASAAKTAKREAIRQGEMLRQASVKADKIAEQQRRIQERSLQKISAGRVRAAQRRVRGGLFGDNNPASLYSISETLG